MPRAPKDAGLDGPHFGPGAQSAGTHRHDRRIACPPLSRRSVRPAARAAPALVLLLLSTQAGAQDPPEIQVRPPPGFEDLLTPQTTLVDVYYAGEPVGSTVATFAPGEIAFDYPGEVVDMIPGLVDRDAVLGALSLPLDPHPELLCPTTPTPGCGRLLPPVAGVVFDATRFRAEIFVSPNHLVLQPLELPKFLSRPDVEESLVTSFAGAVSGASGEDREYNLRNRTILSYRDGRVRLETSYSSEDDLFVERAFAGLDRPGRRYLGGLFRTRALETVSQERIVGVSLGTSLATRLDLDAAFGSQLVVFLSRRSQVDVIREGKLITSLLLDAGNRTIDTSLLPDGAYDVTLRIREIGGQTREETRFFVKSAAIPPKDAPSYFIEGGAMIDKNDAGNTFPEVTSTPLLRGGTMHRVRDNLGLGADFMTSDEQALGQLNALHVSRLGRYLVAGLATTDRDLGVSVSATGRFAGLGYSLSGRRIWAGDTVPNSEVRTDEFDPFTGSLKQLNLSLGHQLGPAVLGFRALWNEDENGGETYSFGPTLNYMIHRDGNYTVNLLAEAARTDSETVAFARLQVRFNAGRITTTASGGYRYEDHREDDGDEDTGATSDTSVSWQDGDLLPGDLTVAGGATKEPGRRLIRAESEYASRRGRYALSAEQDDGNGETTRRYSGTFSVNWLANEQGVALGGREAVESAVIVRLSGRGTDARFEVLVDGHRAGEVAVGQALPLMLPPYEVYEVRLRSADAAFVNFDSGSRTVTLYPGNVATLDWDVNPIQVVFGRAVRPDGSPVGLARISGVVGDAFSDDLGYFQAEVAGSGELTFRPPRGEPCRVRLKELADRQDFVRLGTVTCEPSPVKPDNTRG